MFTVAFAFVVATALFFLFRQTRWMGVVGVFILLCISPLLFTGLLFLVAAAYYFSQKRRNHNVYWQDPPPRNGNTNRGSRNGMWLLGALGVGGALALSSVTPASWTGPSKLLGTFRSTPSEEVIVLRTPGGLLEVSQLHATEVFDARVTHKIFGIEIGELVPRIRAPAIYRYHVELAPEWRVFRREGVFTVIVPAIKPSLPVAIDFAGIERDVSGTWLLQPFKGKADVADLERTITEKLASKAASRDYLDRQREEARETVREFVRKWIVEQTLWKRVHREDVHVLFADETVGILGRLAG